MKKIKVAASVLVARGGPVDIAAKIPSVARKNASTFRPNPVTVAAIKEARQRRGLPRFTSVQALFDDLHADD